MQTWHLLVIDYAVLMVTGQYLGKVFIHKIHTYQILFYQYIASLITVSVYIALLKPESNFFDVPFWFIIIGFMYAFGISSSYRATKQSLSKTKIMGNAAQVLAIILSIIFLGEYELFNFSNFAGAKKLIGVLLAAFSLFSFYKQKTTRIVRKVLIIKYGSNG